MRELKRKTEENPRTRRAKQYLATYFYPRRL